MLKFGIICIALCAFTGALPHQPRLDGRIVGGEQVDIKDFPYQLSLLYGVGHWCGASIINEWWALTAAHCVNGTPIRQTSVRSGSTDNEEGGTLHDAADVIVHPNYDFPDYDFALVKVQTPFALGTPGVDKIVLADEEPKDGTLTVVSGWGALKENGPSPRHLMAVDVHIVGFTECKTQYSYLTDRMICAGDSGKDSCQGDSGGPLVDRTTGKQVGVVSYGYGCAEPGVPGVYSNIASVRAWIRENTGA